MNCHCTPYQGKVHIVKSPRSEYFEVRFRFFKWKIYLGTLWWNVGPAVDCCGTEHWLGRNIRFYPRFTIRHRA